MSDEADKMAARAMRKALDELVSLPETKALACIMAAAHITAESVEVSCKKYSDRADAIIATNPQGKQLAEATAMKRTAEFLSKACAMVVHASRNLADEL